VCRGARRPRRQWFQRPPVGKYVVVHETQQDGSTKIVLDIFNSNTPAG
jgi:hypothetical protein